VVQSIELKQQIENCVRRVPGVLRVEDTIAVGSAQGGGGDSDQVLLMRVRETVLPQIQVSGIDFQCQGGVITVIGTVPQPELKQRLVTLVGQVPGVVNVTDQVTVNPQVQGQATQVQPVQGQATQVEPRREVETTRTFETTDRDQGKIEDEALTATDQTLLVSVRQKVLAEVRGLRNIATEGAWAPALHYRVVNGVVTIIGVIPTVELKRVVQDCVRRVPGVVRVEDTIEVGGTQGSGNLAPTGRTNPLPPTGSTNSLPPGLEKKEQLPSGIQNRDEIPPGLSRRTNDATQPQP
jgi:osmotically-inducible protein OsmY